MKRREFIAASCLAGAVGLSQTVKGASPAADGKLYGLSRQDGTYVLAAKPEFEQLTVNKFADDSTRANACPIVSEGQILLRTDKAIYCIGK